MALAELADIRLLRDWCKCHNDVSHCLVPSVSSELPVLVAELAMQWQIQCHDQCVWCHGLSGMCGRHRAGHVRFERVHSVQPWHLRHRQRPHQLHLSATRLLCLLCGWWCGRSIAGRLFCSMLSWLICSLVQCLAGTFLCSWRFGVHERACRCSAVLSSVLADAV